MLTVHHLETSRSTRVIWLLEELGLPYELVTYRRDVRLRAPPALAEIHPLGKAPVLVDDGLVIAESAVILTHVNERHGGGRLAPARSTPAHVTHEEWLHYAEGSASFPILTTLIGGMTGGLSEGLDGFIRPLLARTFDYIAQGVGAGPFLLGEMFTLADIQIAYQLAVAESAGMLEDRPALTDYLRRLEGREAFGRAVAKGGPMTRQPG